MTLTPLGAADRLCVFVWQLENLNRLNMLPRLAELIREISKQYPKSANGKFIPDDDKLNAFKLRVQLISHEIESRCCSISKFYADYADIIRQALPETPHVGALTKKDLVTALNEISLLVRDIRKVLAKIEAKFSRDRLPDLTSEYEELSRIVSPLSIEHVVSALRFLLPVGKELPEEKGHGGKMLEPRFKPLREGHWKIHLQASIYLRSQIHDWLFKHSLWTWKFGSGGENGKNFTIYVGSFDELLACADTLEREIGHLLLVPAGDIPRMDLAITPHIWARFDYRPNKEGTTPFLESYSSAGIDLTLEDFRELRCLDKTKPVPINLSPQATVKKSVAVIAKACGKYFTGSHNELYHYLRRAGFPVEQRTYQSI